MTYYRIGDYPRRYKTLAEAQGIWLLLDDPPPIWRVADTGKIIAKALVLSQHGRDQDTTEVK